MSMDAHVDVLECLKARVVLDPIDRLEENSRGRFADEAVRRLGVPVGR